MLGGSNFARSAARTTRHGTVPADASGWSDVFRLLAGRGYPVHAPANPLRGVVGDGAYIRDFVSTIEGPVVLAGHSYGGCFQDCWMGFEHFVDLLRGNVHSPFDNQLLGTADDKEVAVLVAIRQVAGEQRLLNSSYCGSPGSIF